MDESVGNCLSLNGVEKLIQVPTGCAEQTMVKMAPAVYAIEYLNASEQWVNFNPEQKEKAISMIEKGMKKNPSQNRKKTTKTKPENNLQHLCYPFSLNLAKGVSIVLT